MNKTWNVRGRLVDISSPLVMGVINITPDSFYKGSRELDVDNVTQKAGKMIDEGADIIDIGGYSSRPGAADISKDVEIERTLRVIAAVHGAYPNALISVDTFRSEVAAGALDAGASIINDISGGDMDPAMPAVAARGKVPYIIMHMRGTPQTMNSLATYDNLVGEVIDQLQDKVLRYTAMGLNDLVVDPGFGFAKTVDQNFELLAKLEALQIIGKPVLVGLSRKSMIWRTLATDADGALNGSTALNMVALMKGVSILRVHDVKEAKECVTLWKKLAQQTSITISNTTRG